MEATLEKTDRKYAIGAECVEGGLHYRIWAPAARHLAFLLEDGKRVPLEQNGEYFEGFVPVDTSKPVRYKLLFTGKQDGKEQEIPDPLSRWSPDGPHGQSVLEVSKYEWHDQQWGGVELRGQIIEEIHIGTFTPEGTYAAAAEKLPLLKEAGITVVELMPLSDFPGDFGWGYDGVQMFAPYHRYGHPDELRAFVDRAHQLGLGVVLDVVYNHFGPDANYIHLIAPEFFTDKYPTPWGSAINFDQSCSGPVREYFREVTAHWIRDFHFDGLRLDATQSIFDEAEHKHILQEVGETVRKAAGGRKTFVVAENDERDTRLMKEYGLDGVWDDDMHHACRVAATGRRSFYLSPFHGIAQELLSAARFGYLWQGQSMVANAGQTTQRAGDSKRSRMGFNTRGLPLWRFVTYIENHDQVSAESQGLRLRDLTPDGQYRALVTYILLGPGTPMLFQGQEFGSRSPFPYFSDHNSDLQALIKTGRWDFLAEFTHGHEDKFQSEFPDPGAESTPRSAVQDWSKVDEYPKLRRFFREVMALRKQETLLWDDELVVDGTLLSQDVLVLRYTCRELERMLVINLGADFDLEQVPNPMIAPPDGKQWALVFSTEQAEYGGHGFPVFEDEGGYHIAAHSALYMKAVDSEPNSHLGFRAEE